MAVLRSVTEADYDAFTANLELTFGFDANPDEDFFRPIIEFDRAIGHFEGERMVSTLSAFSLEMSVPGGLVPCGGTTVVSVAPTHRRQGLLREMMVRHLDDVREREEPIAGLWASESEIYGRFGYGAATVSADLTFLRAQPDLSRLAPPPIPARVVSLDQARELLPPFHDRFRLTQPGVFARRSAWWDARIFADPESRRGEATEARWVVVEDGDGVVGYAKYRIKRGFGDDGHFANEVRIVELLASTPEAWAGLWTYLLNQDLATKFTANLRSPEDPILDLLAGSRRAQAKVDDGLWVRVMDIPRALTARSYSSEFAGVIDVHDPMGITGGRFRLEATPEGASCSPTDRDPDITLDVEDLGAVYLGRAGFRRLARAGRLQGTTQTLTSADLAFGWDPQPWCPEIF